MKIQYTGLAHFRELATADFKKLGVEGQEALTWARGEAKEVEDDVADALHKLLGDEFRKVEEDAKAKKKSLTSDPKDPSLGDQPASPSITSGA